MHLLTGILLHKGILDNPLIYSSFNSTLFVLLFCKLFVPHSQLWLSRFIFVINIDR